MPRVARFVCPGVPHHVTQRGNRRAQVFFSDADCRTYLAWLHNTARQHGLEVLAYCLMTNHIHLVAVPATLQSMELTFRPLHTRYAQRLNRMMNWSGHVWQGRFFSATLDNRYFWSAIRYVEQNPVRAGMVAKGEEFPWSSARAHCLGTFDPLLSTDPRWAHQIAGIGDWSAWLAAGNTAVELNLIRERTARGLPCGSEQFVEQMEGFAGRSLTFRRAGRPPRSGM
jgi:putative transposase